MIASLSPAPVAEAWLAMAAALTGFAVLIILLSLWSAAASPHPEVLRKLLHAGAGTMTLPFPFLFRDVWPVFVLTAVTGGFLATVKYNTRCRRLLGRVVVGNGRRTLGELYFPLAVAAVFWLAHGGPPMFFVIPILVLSLADTASALVGARFGRRRRAGVKSIEGSVAFLVVAFASVHGGLMIWTDAGMERTMLVSTTMALVLTLVEAVARHGRDNLLVPLVGYVLLKQLMTEDGDDLRLWALAAALAACAACLAAAARHAASPQAADCEGS